MSKVRFTPKPGDVLYSAPDKAMGSKPIGVIGRIDDEAMYIDRRNDRSEPFRWLLHDVRVIEKLKSGGWVIEPLFGRTNAPRYWLSGNFLKKVAGVFERQGVYENQADIHWERDEGGLWAVIRVSIQEDDRARTL